MLEIVDARERAAPVHIARPHRMRGEVEDAVATIIADVRSRGDAALEELSARLDGVRIERDRLAVDRGEIDAATELVPPALLDALEVLAARLRRTCERQMPAEWSIEEDGTWIGQLVRPLGRAGIYVPGGRGAYPSTVIMAAVPATVAGVGGIAVCSPPNRAGEIPEAVLAACAVAGVHEVYRVGGAQAVAALAYGTETVRPVDKVVGPGNRYVTAAKAAVRGSVGTDSDAGPSEIAVVADDSAAPEVVAADLVAQAEHGPHGAHLLVTWNEPLVARVLGALDLQVARHRRGEDVENALVEGGTAVLVRDLDQAIETVNFFAPEHLQLMFEGAEAALPRITSAGAVFVGPYSPAVAGDYVAGTNHVLPSGGSARWASGLGVEDFLTRIYAARLDEPTLRRLSPHIDALADAEGLEAHRRAVEMRLEIGGAR